jgi:hypothetical protein
MERGAHGALGICEREARCVVIGGMRVLDVAVQRDFREIGSTARGSAGCAF